MRRPWRNGGSARPCALSRIWGRLHGSLLVCLRKDVAPCHTASRARNGETDRGGATGLFLCLISGGIGRRQFHVHRLVEAGGRFLCFLFKEVGDGIFHVHVLETRGVARMTFKFTLFS